VEPGFEVDMECLQCSGRGCAVCKHTGFIEIMGAGMVHPNVFKAAGYDPREWRGYAFGVGLDRIAMMKYKIPDIRFFHANDIRFLKQF
jgi:phenylalanyl-tRNA synthetase alpha chain